MPSGSFSKRARYIDSIINKKNCGGNKKAGLAPRATGPTEFRNVAFNTSPAVNFKVHKGGLPCPENYSNNPGGQCSGGVGALASTRNRGCRNLGALRPLCSKRQRITLEQALAQGGVRNCQDLIITQQTNHDLVIPAGTFSYVLGLLIDGITFTIARTATVTIATDINDITKSASGILVDNGGKLINHGKIVFGARHSITGNYTTGIQVNNNSEMINSRTGRIHCNTPLQSTEFSCMSIYIVNSNCDNHGNIRFAQITGNTFSIGYRVENSSCNNHGNISFAQITGINAESGGIRLDDDTQFRNGENGIIKFNGEIKTEGTSAAGIIQRSNVSEPSLMFNDGKISFAQITGNTFMDGLLLITNSKLINGETGIIEFNGEITAPDPVNIFGISILDDTCELETNGDITFVNELSTVNNVPADPTTSDRVTGSGNIKFDDGDETYY